MRPLGSYPAAAPPPDQPSRTRHLPAAPHSDSRRLTPPACKIGAHPRHPEPDAGGERPITGLQEAHPVKSALPTALLLAAVVTTGATACGPGVYLCACPPNVFPLMVCGTFLNRHGSRLEPAMPLPLSARSRRVARAPAHSVIPRPAGWGV